MMRTAARLHANLTTRLNRLEEDSEPICASVSAARQPARGDRPHAPEIPTLPNLPPTRIAFMVDSLLSVDWSITLPVWHLDAVQVRRGSSRCFGSPAVGRKPLLNDSDQSRSSRLSSAG